MSDRAPEQYVLGNTVIMQAQWTDPESRELVSTLQPAQMRCLVRHESDNDFIEASAVREGIGPGLYEADYYPDRPGVWYYGFVIEGPPRVVETGSFEIIPNDLGQV